MSKKRNLAVLMAAATVATSVAPVFAAVESQNMDEATLVAEVEKLLGTKYTNPNESGLGTPVNDAHENSVYEIKANSKKSDGTQGTSFVSETIKTSNQLKSLIEKAKLADENVVVNVTDKGHAEVDGKIVATEKSAYTFYADADFDNKDKFDVAVELLEGKDADTAVILNGTDNTATIKLIGGTELEIASADYVLDFSKPLDKDGNKLDLAQAKVDPDTAKKVVGFEKAEATEESTKDIPSKNFAEYVLDASKTIKKYDINDLLTKDGYTAVGAELVNLMTDAQKDAVNGTKVIKNGKEYTVKFVKSDIVKSTKDGYEYKVTYTEQETGKDLVTYEVLVTGKASEQTKLAELKSDIDKKATVKVGNLVKYSGEDRFATAVEISKGAYKTDGSSDTTRDAAKAVVLVGQDAVVDGLAASPLAAQKEAPILLSQKDSVPASTLAEIERTIGKEKTIYIVGGENTISKNVEKQLIDELNAKIVRISGSDRYDTSLEIAEELVTTTTNKAYFVGGNGEADAMSIASVASKEVKPIIVTPADGLNKATKAFISDKIAVNAAVDVIGGTSTVSYDVLKDLNAEANVKDVTRVSGSDRNVTNAKVIEKYFNKSANTVYVAKDGYVGGNGQLIDALAVAPVAAKDGAPIVLSTNELSDNQTKALKGAINTDKKTLVQVGEGTAATVIDALLSLLKLK